MPHQKLRPSFSFDEERIKQLKQIAPEAFADGKINWKVLQDALGENLEEEGQEIEHFGLFWPGKREARRLAAIPSQGTLVPCPGEGVDEENTRNIFIEGENLEVLKLLQKSYAGRIKMIYIDPPYNTGNDFVYEDDFKEPIEEYLRRTGQVDDTGKSLTTNTKTDGRFHSKWLSMMYPRLRLAKNMLLDEGVIFVSIDDNEVHNLKQMMNEIFGEENFISEIPWKGKGGGADNKYLMQAHEYILLYAKDKDSFTIGEAIKENEVFPKYDKAKKRNYKTQLARKWGSNSKRSDRPNLYYGVDAPDGIKAYPKLPDGKDGCWRWSTERMKEEIENGNVEFVKEQSDWVLYEKIYEPLEGEFNTKKYSTWFDDVGSTANGTKELADLFPKKVFDYPKPTTLIDRLIKLSDATSNDIILDFFAGSGTTAHSIYKLNSIDKAQRKYILIQMPFEVDNEKDTGKNAKSMSMNNIGDIAKERIKRAAKLYKKELSDYGFCKYDLKQSNYKKWGNYIGTDARQLEAQFEEYETPLKSGWKKRDLLVEIMLLEGFPLDSKIEKLKGLDKNKVEIVTSDFCEHRLLVCLDDKIYTDTTKDLQYQENDIFICLDSALTDQLKLTLADKCLLKTI